ncbi:NusA N-terminal domain-containing protein [Vitiosangium sp. GDMCC 1.1324]|uniref:DUF6891 domain-containing protein n=1 Tax=Vitiosangium sp. (strain GDMCC 1.1324) TaxID=2138576 RepID=UPI000D393F4B|nr:NusA N-terminal domain-containing protein [Vitiosangium sp. GDMCC 1.1324]PTL81258.1 hypothetical protein DAT35_24385 [Vitiosangium sp. GDMCC 1.1324]
MATSERQREYLREQVEIAVRGGYLDEEEVLAFVKERVEDELRTSDATEEFLAYARRLLEEHRAEEAGWSGPTTNDAIDRAFEELNRQGIIALQNAGYTLSDGWDDVAAAKAERYEPVRGSTFFHGQDVERGVLGMGLMLVFGSFERDPKLDEEASLAIAREVRETLARHGVETEWNGSVKTRISIPPFPWRKRGKRAQAADDTDTGSRFERVLRRVCQEKGLTREAGIAALEAFVCEVAWKHYGEGRCLEAQYNPEQEQVELYQAIMVVEQPGDAVAAVNQRTPAQLGELEGDVEPGDELVFQIFYRKEEAYLAQAQDEKYGGILDLKTFGRSLPSWTVRELRDGILGHLPASAR